MAPNKSIGSLKAMAKNIKEKTTTKLPSSITGAAAGFKSTERVQDSDTTSSSGDSSSGSDNDSDSEDSLEAAKKKLEAKNAAKKATTTSKPAASGKTANATTTTSKPSTKKPASTSSSSASSDSDSDSDSKKISVSASKTGAGKKTIPTQKDSSSSNSSSSSSEDDDDDSDSDAGAKVQSIADAVASKATKAKAALPSKKPAKEVEESSESESDDEGTSNAVARVNGISEGTEVAKPEWLNKSDFMLRKASSDNPGKEVSEFLSKSNLEGKQVWYFTAPASLPITVIKDMEIDLAKVPTGGAILNHQGDAYGLDLEPYTTSSQIQLLIPSKGGDKYSTLNRAIDSTVHLRRIAEFGGSSKVSSTATDQYVRQMRPVREQPKNLKPRFTPIGVPTKKPVAAPEKVPATASSSKAKAAATSVDSSSSDEDSDIEMTDAATLPPPVLAGESGANVKTNGASKRKLKPETSTSSSASSEDSDSEDDAPPPKKLAKKTKVSPVKELVKPKAKSSAPAVQAENTALPSAQLSKTPQASKAIKSTPIPPPTLGRSVSEISAPSATPSKAADSAKTKKDKKSKKGETPKTADTVPKAVKQTPIPPPKFGVSQ